MAPPLNAVSATRSRFKIRMQDQADTLLSVLKPFADLNHTPASLLLAKSGDGWLLLVVEFDSMSAVHTTILRNAVRRLSRVVVCDAGRLDVGNGPMGER